MQLRKNSLYDLVTVSSMGLRLTPVDRQPVHTGNLFRMESTSAETNVLNISSSLGLSTKVLTKFVSDSPFSLFIKGELRKRNIAYEGKELPQGGPWGYRHQINVADSGFGVRGPRVFNDRAGEVGLTLNASDFDFERLFAVEGCKILHLSGLVAALSKEATACCLAAARLARKHGTLISFDLNYRASFWENRERELGAAFGEIASLADILIGNEEDFQLALGVPGPAAGGTGLAGKIAGFREMIGGISAAYPGVRVFANTLREAGSANAHEWGAILYTGGEWYTELPRTIQVADRIGGGDGFVGGLLYGILKAWEPQKWLQFGWATGALAVSSLTDFAWPADEEQVWSIYEGNARVKR